MSEYKQDSDKDQGLIIKPSRRIFLGSMVAGSTLGLSGCSLIDLLSGDFFTSTKDDKATERLVKGKSSRSSKKVARRSSASRKGGKSMSLDRYDARYLSFQNTHTGEKLKVTYWEDGKYLRDAMAEVNHHLRDHRSDERRDMDPGLLDQLFVLRKKLDTGKPFHVISGYRSPRTNAMLRRQGRGVARRSLHMTGKAIDIRVPGRSLSQVRLAALSMHSGGVGYYPGPQFVHIDTGRVRRW
jgi:uncharacterized protein YcbK (DUF882 family)